MEELTLDQIQNESFKVLVKFKEICEKNGFKYFLAYGTLLGAIRHNGFIPWDDDIDVWMPRPDYEKFVDYCMNNAEQVKPFELKHWRTCKEYIYPIARLSDSRYKLDYKNAKDYGLGLFIDIYPLDGINSNDKKHLRTLSRKQRDIRICGSKNLITPSKSKVRTIFKTPYYLYVKTKKINKLLKEIDILAQKYKYNESEYVDCVVWCGEGALPKNYFSDTVDVKFHNELLAAPRGYDKLLTHKYGDYMQLPPQEDRIAHHFYCAYKRI